MNVKRKFGCHAENSKTTEELDNVKKFKSALSDWREGLEEKKRKRELQKQNLAKQLVELEEGEILPSLSPSPENCFGSTSDNSDIEEEMNGGTKRQTVFDILKDIEDGGIPTRSHHTKDPAQRVSEKGKISTKSQGGGILDNLVDMEDGEILGKETERPFIMEDDHNCQKEIPQRSLETSQLRSMDKEQQIAENEIVRLGKITERPITMANDRNFQTENSQKCNRTSRLTPCSSGSEIKADKIQHTSAAATGSGSPNVPAHVSDTSVGGKELPASHDGTIIVVDSDSDTDSDVVELTDQKSVTSTSNVKNNVVSSFFNGLKDGVTRSNSVEKPSPENPQSTLDEVAMADQAVECSAENIPASNMQNTEVNSYPPGFEDRNSRSTSLEKHSIDKNTDKVDSIAISSENLQSSSHEDIVVDRLAACAVHALPIQEQSAPVEVANLPESQDGGAVTPVCSESHVHFMGTGTSVVPPDIGAVQDTSITFNQPPLSSASSSSQSGSLQCPQNVGRHTSSPEVQASTQPFSGDAVQLSFTPSVVDLQQQLRNVQTNGNATQFHEPGSTTNAPDIRSMAASLASTNANLLLPGSSQPPRYDPLQNELDRLQKDHDQDIKKHEAMVLNMQCTRDEAIEEINKKYEVLFQEANATMQCVTREYKAKFLQIYLNNLLANTWMFHEKQASTPNTREAAPDLINVVQNPTPQMSTVRLDQHPPVTVPFQNPTPQMSTVRLDQHPPVTVPFRQVMINHPSPVPFRPEMINQPSPVPTRPFSGHTVPQNGYQFRVAAPHLRASRPPTTHFPGANSAEFIQQMQMSSDNH
ncbi:hypothetical protein M5689_015777 [Euphorbia peplus]|nr:hypothetical protein M5689_015777 [Euphorbia peplus]